MKSTRFKILTLILTAVLVCGCSPSPSPSEAGFSAMDTFMTLKIYGQGSDASADKIEKMIKSLDSLLSAADSESEISAVNSTEDEVRVSAETFDLVEKALGFCKATDGALDITVLPVVETWGFVGGDYKVPSDSELKDALSLVDYRVVALDKAQSAVKTPPGVRLDLGAVAKGYSADKSRDILSSEGSQSAILNLGGTVLAHGKKPDGSPWKVGIANPENSADYMGYLSCADKIIATSGGYERYFTGVDGKIYRHIIDPKTGCPVDNELTSVTVISDNGLLCDALSTALYVMGLDKAQELWRERSDFDFVILTDGTAYITEGIADSFSLASGFEDMKLVTVK